MPEDTTGEASAGDVASQSSLLLAKALRESQEFVVTSQSYVRRGQQRLMTRHSQLQRAAVRYEHMTLNNQTALQETLREVRAQQRELKASQDQFDHMFTNIETIISNQYLIKTRQRIIIANQMKIHNRLRALLGLINEP